MNELAQEASEVFAQDFEARGIRFVVDTAMPVVMGERTRFRQILHNLIDNAVKYMGDGSAADSLSAAGMSHEEADPNGRVKAIHIGVEPEDGSETGRLIRCYVRDTGIGIEESELGNVFRVFRRGKSQAVQSVAGKGVGLASVKSIVENYGGAIRVQSKPGLGSRFVFTIDAKHRPADMDQKAPAAA